MNINADKNRLLQAKNITKMKRGYKSNDWISVYRIDELEQSKHYIYCALVPSSQIEDALANSTCDLEFARGIPGGMTFREQGELHREYLRFGVDNGVEPLIINRSFYGLREEYSEISEEFRLFHKLYHDRKTDEYFKINDDGGEELVATIKPNHIQIRLQEIRQFLAIKEMHLAIQFIIRETSLHTLDELELQAGDENYQDGLMCWLHRYGDLSEMTNFCAFSRLVGKRLLEPLPKVKRDILPYSNEHQNETTFKKSKSTENVFVQCYCSLQKVCEEQLGEQWLLPLNQVDAYYFVCLKNPFNDQKSDSDNLVTLTLCLSKIINESLNEAYLRKMIPFEKREKFKGQKSIALLEAAMHLNEIEGAEGHIDFLRKLEDLRSSGSAHRKGENYENLAKHFGIEDKNLRDVFTEILISATYVLEYFITLIKSGRIREIVEKNQMAAGYAVMGEMIGIVDVPTDDSVNHDAIIYETESKT